MSEVRIFVCAHAPDVRVELDHLRREVLPELSVVFDEQFIITVAEPPDADPESALLRQFAEIDACGPWVIALVGDDGGPRIGTFSETALARCPWLNEHTGASIVELAIRYAARDRNADTPPVTVFVRRPKSTEGDTHSGSTDDSEPTSDTSLSRLTAALEALEHVTVYRYPDPKDEPDGELWRNEFTQQAIEALGEMLGSRHSTHEELDLPSLQQIEVPTTESAAPVAEAAPPYLDDNVQFTVYQPRTVQVERWYPMVAFAHLDEAPEDAPPDECDPIEAVEQEAKRLLGNRIDQYRDTTQDSLAAIPRDSTITFVPEAAGVRFNPPRASFDWVKSWHKAEFELRASAASDAIRRRGTLTVYLGALIVATIPLRLEVRESAPDKPDDENRRRQSAHAYRKIFPSYSHKDYAVVEQFERYASALGDTYLRDCRHLRAGEDWSARLEDMIEEAQVFQLFWSRNAAASPFVANEYRFALSLARDNFVRPTYWQTEEPEPSPPSELARIHFQRIAPLEETTIPAGARSEARDEEIAGPPEAEFEPPMFESAFGGDAGEFDYADPVETHDPTGTDNLEPPSFDVSPDAGSDFGFDNDAYGESVTTPAPDFSPDTGMPQASSMPAPRARRCNRSDGILRVVRWIVYLLIAAFLALDVWWVFFS